MFLDSVECSLLAEGIFGVAVMSVAIVALATFVRMRITVNQEWAWGSEDMVDLGHLPPPLKASGSMTLKLECGDLLQLWESANLGEITCNLPIYSILISFSSTIFQAL